MNEIEYQRKLIKKLQVLIPGSLVIKNDPSFMQGIPDVLVLYRDKWAMLEIKIDGHASIQPNQAYYVKLLGEMSFASFITPETEEDVLHDLQQALGVVRTARISQPK